MARKRTAEEIEKAKKLIRKYNGRIASMNDWMDLLGLTKHQLKYTLDNMHPDEAEEIRMKTAHLNRMRKNAENLVTLYFTTKEQLGVKYMRKREVGKFINPLTHPCILTDGRLRVRKYDILYVVEVIKQEIRMQKYLINEVTIKGSRFQIEALTIVDTKFKREDLEFLDEFDGIDRYVLSIV